jgi:hypothetical protein
MELQKPFISESNQGFFRKSIGVLRSNFKRLDRKTNNSLSFFIKHWGKSKFMISMSKKLQMHGLENVFFKGKKAFFYFFMFYLIRDTILYIIIPIYFAKSTGQ